MMLWGTAVDMADTADIITNYSNQASSQNLSQIRIAGLRTQKPSKIRLVCTNLANSNLANAPHCVLINIVTGEQQAVNAAPKQGMLHVQVSSMDK